MKKGRFAVYNGKEYSADFIKGKGIVLRSQNSCDIDMGFQKYDGYNKSIVAIKFVDRSELSEFYRLITKALYAGYEFEVIEEKENMISIVAMTGDYKDWLDLEMVCIDKGVYQKWIRVDEAEIKIIKEEL